jgi:transposase
MSQEIRIIDCQNMTSSRFLAQERIQRAQQTMGQRVIQRILCFSLYLLGVNRRIIGQSLDIPTETAKSIIKAIGKNGLSALEDRRCRTSAFLPPSFPQISPITVYTKKDHIIVDYGIKGRRMEIPRQNVLQVRAILLSMLNSHLLSRRQVSDIIGLTPSHTATLANRLANEGLSALIDKRQGQKSDYRITPEIKAELVQQFTLDIITRGKTSGETISSELKERCHINIPARTVRHHLLQMGLPKIKHSLPQLFAALKKTSR